MKITSKITCALLIVSAANSMETVEHVEHSNAYVKSPIESIPNDILIDILSALPPKGIMKLSTVCKNWHDITPQARYLSISAFFKERWTNPNDYATPEKALETYKLFWGIAPKLAQHLKNIHPDKIKECQGLFYGNRSEQLASMSSSFLKTMELSTLGSRNATKGIYNCLITCSEIGSAHVRNYFGHFLGYADPTAEILLPYLDADTKELYYKFSKHMTYLIENHYTYKDAGTVFFALKSFSEDNLNEGNPTLGKFIMDSQ